MGEAAAIPEIDSSSLYLYRSPHDPEVVPTELIKPAPAPDGYGLAGRARWVVIRTCESLLATGSESLGLLLQQLNYKLTQIRTLLLTDSFHGYIDGFNRLENPETKRPPFVPPTELLLVLLGAPRDAPLEVDKFLDPDAYPRPMPAWLRAEPTRPWYYSDWSSVFETVSAWANTHAENRSSACDVVEASLHLLREAVVFPKDPALDLHEYGSAIVLTQYRRPSDGLWVTTELRNIRDVRCRDLPESHFNNLPHFDVLPNDSYTWSERNARVSCINAGVGTVEVKLRVVGNLPQTDYASMAKLRRVRMIYSSAAADAVKFFSRLAVMGRLSGNLSTLLEQSMDYFLSSGQVVPTMTRLGDHNSRETLQSNRIHLILDTLEWPEALSNWRPPQTARCRGAPVFDGNLIAFTHPGVLLAINVVLIRAVAPAEPPRTPELHYKVHDLHVGSYLDVPTPTPETPDVVEFDQWLLPERSTPQSCKWIAAVILNRLRAVIFARVHLNMPARLSDWYRAPYRSYPYEFATLEHLDVYMLQIPTAGDATPSYDAYVRDNRPNGHVDLALFPGLLERRPLVGRDGSINMRWLTEVYAEVYRACGGGDDTDPLTRTESQLWDAYAPAFIASKWGGHSRALQWFYWRRNKLGIQIVDEVPLYKPAAGISEYLWASDILIDRGMVDMIVRTRIERALPIGFRPLAPGVGASRPAPPAIPPGPARLLPYLPLPAGPAAKRPPAGPAAKPPPVAAGKLPVVVLDPTAEVNAAKAFREQARRDVASLNKQYNDALAPLVARYGPNAGLNDGYRRDVRPWIRTLNKPWNEPGGERTTPAESLAITERALAASTTSLTQLLRELQFVNRLDSEAQLEYSRLTATEAMAAQRDEDLAKILKDLATAIVVRLDPSLPEETRLVVSRTLLVAALNHPRQQRTIDTLLASAKRTSIEADRSALNDIARGWQNQLATTREELDTVDKILVKGDPIGEALMARIERSIGMTRTPPMTYPAAWPTKRADFTIAKQIADNANLWRDRVTAQLQSILGNIVANYQSTRNAVLRKLGEASSPATPADNLLARSEANLFVEVRDEPATRTLLLGVVVSPEAAERLLRRAIATEPNDARSVFDRIRTSYLDCAVMFSISHTPWLSETWKEIQDSFELTKSRARIVEDYFKAYIDVIAKETGWCAYAHKRHWLYVPDDPSNHVLVSGNLKQWRAFTRWSDVRLKGAGDAERPSDSADAVSLAKAEAETLTQVEKLWRDMWSAAMVDTPLTSAPGATPHSLPSPALRFVQLGNTVEECWKRLEIDQTLYIGILQHLIPEMGGITTPVSAYQVFLRLSLMMLGMNSVPLLSIESLSREAIALANSEVNLGIERLHSNVLRVALDGLTRLAIWPSVAVTPSNWWHGNNTSYLAYEYSRARALLTPQSDSTEDDFHGMTIALTEFFAFGRPGLWERYNELNAAVAPVSRPTTSALATAAIGATARRYRTRNNRGDAAAFSKWIARTWSNTELVRVIAMARTYGRMFTVGDRLVLTGELSPNRLSMGWNLRERLTPIGAGEATAEGHAMLRALASEIGALVFGAVSANATGTAVVQKTGTTKGALIDALYYLLGYLMNGSLGESSAGESPGIRSVLERFSQWVYQQSTAASTLALPRLAAPAQWVHVLGLMLQAEYAPPGTGEKVPAAERLNLLQESAMRTLPTLVSAVEGDVESASGTRFLPLEPPKPLYNPAVFDNAATVKAGEDSIYHVAWPLALGQAVRKRYQTAAPATESRPAHSEVLSFLYSTLLRDDTKANEPVPFFVAVKPENPAGPIYHSGFSARAAADYCAASRFRVEMDVITPEVVAQLAQLERYARVGVYRGPILYDEALSRLFFDNSANRNRLLLHVDTRIDAANLAAFNGIWSPEREPYTTERGIYTLIRRSNSSTLARESLVNSWVLLSAWGLDQPAAGAPGTLIESLTAVVIKPDEIPLLSSVRQQNLYLNPLYPVSGGDPRWKPEVGYVRWRREPAPASVLTKRLDLEIGWPQLQAMSRSATILSEKSALLDWHERLLGLDQKRRLRSDYAAVLNGDGTLLYALRRDQSSDALTDARLDELKRDLERRLEEFREAAERLFARLKPALGDVEVFDAYRDSHRIYLDGWIIDTRTRMLEAYVKARSAIIKAISKRTSAEDTRAKIDKALERYSAADRVDARKRDGWLAALVGIKSEAEARQISMRVLARMDVLRSIRDP